MLEMTDEKKTWESYEEVAQYLLNQFASQFGLGHVEGKQCVPGESGTEWEIDAKGVANNGDGFLIIECRRYTKSKLSQESIAALAFRIQDTGANGAIVVSPLDLQSGAKLVAAHKNIQHVILDPKSTTTEYVLRFLNQVFVGLTERVCIKESVSIKIIRDGKIVEERHYE